MALDNPSYFTIPGGTSSSASNRTGRFSILRKHVRMGTAPSSASTSSLPSTKQNKNERYSLLPTSSNMNAPSPLPQPSPAPSPDTGFRRSFRSLLRTTSFDNPIQTQMLVLGMPRPSDIAPSHRPFAHSGKKHHARTASAGKTHAAHHSDPSGSPRPVIATKEPLLPVDERYYNVLSETNGRRHSIGAYFTRKGTNVPRNGPKIQEETTLLDESAKVDFKFSRDTPPTRKKHTGEANRKKCSCCQTSQGGRTGMEDIVIVSSGRSQAADLWTSYLKTCFDQIRKNRNKPPFRILSVGIEDSGGSEGFTLQEKLSSAKLVVFILCPVFLDYVAQNPQKASHVCSHVRPESVLAMLLGIGESAITDEHKAAMTSYPRWRRMESVKDRDEKFVGEFLGAGMDILSKNLTQQPQGGEKGAFMLMPKKVNKSQNKVMVLLNEPITKEDVMRVTVLRNNEAFDVPSVKKRNPYTLIFRMPDEFLAVSTLVSIRVDRNGTDLGTKLLKCESQLYALVQILKSCDSPVEFMCQALNIVPCDKDKLDDFLVSAFQRNIPPNFNLLQTSPLGHLRRGVSSKDEYPTLLHFAARYGLEKLCWLLLECPGGEVACDIRNASELTPAEMADASGHSKLANALCGYMQMTEFTSVYTFLKGMTDDKNNSKSDSSDDYLNPRPLSETYQVPPSPRPLAPFGYMQMHSPKSSQGSSIFGSQEAGTSSGRELASSKEKLLQRKESGDSLRRAESEQKQKSRENSGNGIQDELIEIINDFKNNVFTISEVEKLVEEWKNRNDVQQSYREKQEQLNKMREEYERVQQRVKEEMKQVGRPSPMERIRNFFRSKSKEKTEGAEGEKKCRQEETTPLHRPSSGLSIQSSSSSSSGRLSTGSHCSGTSLGDSGTHSDAESERKFRPTTKCCSIPVKTKDSLDNYDIPPNPVCLFSSKSKQSNGISNYDIPPAAFPVDGDNDPCPSYETHSPEVNYYNLVGKEIPVPNESTLHGRLAGSQTWLKVAEEGGKETKTDDGSNCYEYINLPNVNGVEKGKRVAGESDEGSADEMGGETDVLLPDYVNLEKAKAAPK